MIKAASLAALIALAALLSSNGTAAARHHRTAAPLCQFLQPCDQPAGLGRFLTSGPESSLAGGIVGHPHGCPFRAFCGCGASVRAFGRSIRSLWLAAAWGRFPPTGPGAGMAAYRRHHVFILEHHISGRTWMVYDANSGGHHTRIHPRSIAGFRIVNPYA